MLLIDCSYIPKYGSREVVIICGSLTTCDPSNIFDTIQQMKKDNIQCSIVGISPEMYVCKAIAETTGGILVHILIAYLNVKRTIQSCT